MDWQRHLIEHILDLLSLFQEKGLDLSQLPPDSQLLEQLPSSGLRAACKLLRFMDEIPGGFLIYYASGDERIVYANQGLLHIFQCSTFREFLDLTDGSFRGLVHPDDLDGVEDSIRQQIAASQYDLDYVEYRITRKDGAIRWIEDYGHFIHCEAGDFFYVFLGDATERREHRLRERARERAQQEERLQNLIEQYDQERALINQEHLHRLEVIEGLSVNYESIFYADLSSDLLLSYRSSLRSKLLYQQEPDPCGYQRYTADYVRRWVHPEDQEFMDKALSPEGVQEQLKHTASFYLNYRAVMPEKEIQYLQLQIVSVGHADGDHQIVMGCRRVDHELRQEMERRQMLAEALEKANLAIVAKNTFLSNMSHDMRTPLNAIFGFTALARKHIGQDDEVMNYLKRVDASSRQLLDLINKVLELSWNGSNEPAMKEEPCDLNDIMEEIYAFLQPQAEEKQLTFTLDHSGVSHHCVYSDEEKLKQLFLYLLNNAVTYTQPGGRVSVTAQELEHLSDHYTLYQFVVQDTGIGISEEFLAQIFEPFSREKNTTLSGIHGIGLGLTISKNIVDMMGGAIDVQSTVGKGSTFTITLHFQIQPQRPDTSDPPPSGGFNPEGRRLLLVEDNEINLEIETVLLQELGFVIDVAVNGSIAVDRVNAAEPGTYDFILMDIQMPVMDGWQAASAIRRLSDPAKAHVPIIALSANVFDSDIQKSRTCGMDAHLPKPLDVPLLLQTMEETLRERQNAS